MVCLKHNIVDQMIEEWIADLIEEGVACPENFKLFASNNSTTHLLQIWN